MITLQLEAEQAHAVARFIKAGIDAERQAARSGKAGDICVSCQTNHESLLAMMAVGDIHKKLKELHDEDPSTL